MTYKRGLFIAASLLLLVSQFSQRSGVATSAPTQSQTAPPPTARRLVDREALLLDKLKAILEPLGIIVVESALVDAEKVRNTQSLTIHWDAYPDAAEKMLPAEKVKDRPAGRGMRLTKSQKRQYSESALQRRYGFELSTDKLFIAAVDAKSQLKWWELITDPRIVRGESVGPDGQFVGEVYYRTQPDILLSIPDEEGITEIRIFKPNWTGTNFMLEQLASVPVTN